MQLTSAGTEMTTEEHVVTAVRRGASAALRGAPGRCGGASETGKGSSHLICAEQLADIYQICKDKVSSACMSCLSCPLLLHFIVKSANHKGTVSCEKEIPLYKNRMILI
jgi:hypothetical protein